MWVVDIVAVFVLIEEMGIPSMVDDFTPSKMTASLFRVRSLKI
jgi:hypothetical protein